MEGDKMVNTQIRQFRDSLIALTNANPLPIEIKRLVFGEIKMQIDLEAENVLKMEREQAKTESEEGKNE
jgi:hypothetical protein